MQFRLHYSTIIFLKEEKAGFVFLKYKFQHFPGMNKKTTKPDKYMNMDLHCGRQTCFASATILQLIL